MILYFHICKIVFVFDFFSAVSCACFRNWKCICVSEATPYHHWCNLLKIYRIFPNLTWLILALWCQVLASWVLILIELNQMSMVWYKKDVTPLLMHWSYIFLALTHRYNTFWLGMGVICCDILGLDDVMTCKYFPHYWHFVRGILWLPSYRAWNAELWCFLPWANFSTNSGVACYWRCHCTHVTVMLPSFPVCCMPRLM